MSGGKLTRATQEAAWVRYTLLTVGLGFLFFFLGLPLIAVFVEALAQGLPAYLEALKEPETRSAIWLTVAIALAVLPFNVLFGVASGWPQPHAPGAVLAGSSGHSSTGWASAGRAATAIASSDRTPRANATSGTTRTERARDMKPPRRAT